MDDFGYDDVMRYISPTYDEGAPSVPAVECSLVVRFDVLKSSWMPAGSFSRDSDISASPVVMCLNCWRPMGFRRSFLSYDFVGKRTGLWL